MKAQREMIDKSLKNLPQAIGEILQQDTEYPHSFISSEVVDKLCEKTRETNEQIGLALLPLATAFAEAPVSHFFVGAVAFDSVGNAYLGANFEFSDTHIGQTIHAEQSAISHAWSRGAKDLALLVINYAPCGHCRQFINEVNLADNFRILLPETQPKALSEYLPNAFGPADLNMDARILGNTAAVGDDINTLAQTAHENAHAPYSNSKSGVVVQFSDGGLTAGYYAENAAFNPSLPPLQMALNVRRLQGKDWRAIEKVLMIETATTLSQKENTQELLSAIGAKAEFVYRK